jgi:hypothetical protein
MIDRLAAPRGLLEVRVWRDGRLIEHTRDANMIVVGSKFMHAQLLGGAVAGNSVTQVGFGSTTIAAAGGNTALSVDAYIKPVDGIDYPASNQVAFGISLGAFEANGLLLAEYGLLSDVGTLYARLVRAAPMVKDASIVINSTWTVTF